MWTSAANRDVGRPCPGVPSLKCVRSALICFASALVAQRPCAPQRSPSNFEAIRLLTASGSGVRDPSSWHALARRQLLPWERRPRAGPPAPQRPPQPSPRARS
eukprot:6328237-Prymnesium_polylepis.1